MSAGTAGGAAAAAAEQQRLRNEEEEEMTPYSPEDLADGWEFKILRSNTGAFRKPERLRAALEEEARAGWALVEKFDNGRVRLKRPASARKNDATLDFDPYRSHLGGGCAAGAAVLMAIGTFAALGACALLIASE